MSEDKLESLYKMLARNWLGNEGLYDIVKMLRIPEVELRYEVEKILRKEAR